MASAHVEYIVRGDWLLFAALAVGAYFVGARWPALAQKLGLA